MDDREVELQLEAALEECWRLKEENATLRRLLGNRVIVPVASDPKGIQPALKSAGPDVDDSSGRDAKVALFRSLFRGREDVYAVRKRFKNGEWGYVPESIKNWEAVLSADAALREKVDRETRKLVPLTDDVVRQASEPLRGAAAIAHMETQRSKISDVRHSYDEEDLRARQEPSPA